MCFFLLFTLVETSLISHLHCCMFSQTVLSPVLFSFGFCFFFLCVFIKKKKKRTYLCFRHTHYAYSTIDFSHSIVPLLVLSLMLTHFCSLYLLLWEPSFHPAHLILPRVLPIAAGLFDANKSFRRYFLIKGPQRNRQQLQSLLRGAAAVTVAHLPP